MGVNAIEFMPVMEFEGNDSWGYNPSFHLALDKYYGTPDAFKALIDSGSFKRNCCYPGCCSESRIWTKPSC